MPHVTNRVMTGLFLVAMFLLPGFAESRSTPDVPSAPSSAADETPTTFREHDINHVRLPVTNYGRLGFQQTANDGHLTWNDDVFLYVGSLWVGAHDENGEARVTTDTEFRPTSGPAGAFHGSGAPAPGGKRRGLDGSGDDDRDGLVDEDPLNGLDDDGDGRVDEDYEAIGAQMFTTEYRDDQVAVSAHVPLGLRVRQQSMEWLGPEMLDGVAIQYEIANVGDKRLRDVYVGLDLDLEAGPPDHPQYWTDDLVGFSRIDVPRPPFWPCARPPATLDILYAWDAPDNGTTIVGGDTPGYVGVLFLGYEAGRRSVGPESGRLATARWVGTTGTGPFGPPRTDLEHYDLMSSGQIPLRNANKPDDCSVYAFTGPFPVLDPGDQITVFFGLVLGNGYDEMERNAITMKRVYDGLYVDADRDPTTGVGGRETCALNRRKDEPAWWDDPCDPVVYYEYPTFDPCFWYDADCDSCTGVGGRETALHWVDAPPPPDPSSNVDRDFSLSPPEVELYAVPAAGDARVTLQWDNASELPPDPVRAGTGSRVIGSGA